MQTDGEALLKSFKVPALCAEPCWGQILLLFALPSFIFELLWGRAESLLSMQSCHICRGWAAC